MLSVSRSRLTAGLLASTAVLALPAAALAQDADSSLETVVVTGTLLKGVAPVGNHLVTFDSTDIQKTGAVNPTQVLANIPQVSNLFGRDPATATAGGGTTEPPAAIRNLPGKGVTLVLIDGHNVVGNGGLSTATDASAVPAIALQRVDVVLDGGSAIYGSDAVAGTINFITRKSFEGLQVQTAYGTTGNYDSFDLGVIGGHAWSSGNAYLAYQYHNNSNQLNADRPYGRTYLVPLGGTVDSRSTACAFANVKAGAATYALNTSAVANTPGALKAAAAVGTNKCDTSLNATSYPTDTQNTVWGRFTQHIADGVDLTVTANWEHRATVSLGSQLQTVSATITNANPYFQSIAGETQQSVSFNYSPVFGNNFGTRVHLDQEGILPELTVKLGGDWDLTLFGNYQRSYSDNDMPQNPAPSVATALTTSDPNYALDPYNLALSPAAVLHQIVDFSTRHLATQQLEQGGAQVNGSVFSLPGGDVKLAAGVQYRYDSVVGLNVTGPYNQVQGPAVAGGVFIPGAGHRYVTSVFGEALIPLVGEGNELPFVHALNVDLSGRYDHYSDFGGTSNPKIGVTYEPIAGLTLRGNLSTSFVAPSLDDGAGAVDTRVTLQTSSAVREPISLSGVSPAQDAIDALRPGVAIAGGSAGLQPQKANTYSYGFDFKPDFVPGLEVGLTAWHVSFYHIIGIIPYTNASLLYGVPAYTPYYIIKPTLAQVQALTAGLPMQGFSSYAALYQNGANSTPYQFLDLRRHNLGNQFNEGLDLHLAYAQAADFGDWDVGLDGTTFTLYKLQGYTGEPKTDQLAANVNPYSFQAHVGATVGALTGKLTLNYVAGYTVTGVTGQTHVAPYQPVNLYLGYDLDGAWDAFSNTTVSLNVNNLFDANPPFLNQGNGVATTSSTLGRYFQLGLVKKF